MKFYEIPQAVGEPADVFITKKELLATRIAPHITKAEFNGFCRMWLRDGHHLLEEPRHAANDVVPSAPFVGEPAPRHHERPHQQRDQQPVEHLTLDKTLFNEEDAAGVPPQEAGGPRHAQDVHRDRCTQPLLEHERGEATTAVVRPEDVRTELIDQKLRLQTLYNTHNKNYRNHATLLTTTCPSPVGRTRATISDHNTHQIQSQNEPKGQLIAKPQVELTLTKMMLPMI
jgi:hypothetical protein